MQVMPAITAAATHRALSAGALLAVGGGLALYQLTSLVLGPVGSRELHLSLTIPAANVDEPSLGPTVRARLVLGKLTAPTGAPPAAPHPASGRLAARPRAAPRPTPAPAIAPAVPLAPVESASPTTHPSDKPKLRHDD
jgi:hypothetical protein